VFIFLLYYSNIWYAVDPKPEWPGNHSYGHVTAVYICLRVCERERESERERKRKRGGCLVIKGRILQPARLKYPHCLNYTVPPGSYALNYSMTTWRAVLQNQLVSPLNYATYTIYHLLTLKELFIFPTQCVTFHLFCEQTGINSLNCTAGLNFVMEAPCVFFLRSKDKVFP